MSPHPEPTVHGHVAPGFEGVGAAMVANVVEHGEVGAAVCVHVDGEVVVDCWVGHRDEGRSEPWAADTLVDVYSVGKAIVSVLVLQLVDEGRIGLDDPVAEHWPEFAAGGKERATVRHLLSHRAGVPAIREPLTDGDLFDFHRMVAAVAATEAWWPPGERHVYHTNTFGHLTGGLLHAVTGRGPGALLRERVTGPLGADVHFGVPDGDLHRCAELIWAGDRPIWQDVDLDALEPDQRMTLLSYANPPGYSSVGVVNSTAWRQAEIPSTNGHATARGVAAVYQGLLDGRLLSDELLAEATRAQSSGWCPTLAQDVTFGLGFQPWTENRPLGRTPGGYGHFGTGGSLGFADPARRIAFGYVMNHVIPRWQSPRNRALVDALYAALG
ncbi:MAG TPA: serine hydrolase domain-containing protein [Acidimicrobiales bacterium]|nr:serine hydrolase domain-containing protein [Acidimicrobiales bacterium]